MTNHSDDETSSVGTLLERIMKVENGPLDDHVHLQTGGCPLIISQE